MAPLGIARDVVPHPAGPLHHGDLGRGRQTPRFQHTVNTAVGRHRWVLPGAHPVHDHGQRPETLNHRFALCLFFAFAFLSKRARGGVARISEDFVPQ